MDEIEYWDAPPTFGMSMTYGSCNAYIVVPNEEHGPSKSVCGYPMRSIGVCMNRDYHHPKDPRRTT